jgi:hypothetical protein
LQIQRNRCACSTDSRHQCVNGRVDWSAQRDWRARMPDDDIFHGIAESRYVLGIVGQAELTDGACVRADVG